MGTTYHVTHDSPRTVTQAEIDALLIEINLSVSTYIDSSVISQINKPADDVELITLLKNGKPATCQRIYLPVDNHFITIFKNAENIWRQSDGYFDPTVMPLVNYWGFGYTAKDAISKVDSSKISKLLSTVGLEQVQLEADDNFMTLLKPASLELDFSAIAKGYAVDKVLELIASSGAENIFVEIGGEVSTLGHNASGKPWRIGLNKPAPKAALNEISEIVNLSDIAMASSGNYRNYHTVGNKKYGHQINPKSGYPEQNELLGVSIISESCMEADAVATACMIMGMDRAIRYVKDRLHLEGCFFYSDDKGDITYTATKGFDLMILSN